MPFDQQEFEVDGLRSADAAPGGPLPAHNRIGDDPVLQRLIEGRQRLAFGWCQHALRLVDGSVCARGALLSASAVWWNRDADAVALIADALLLEQLPPEWRAGHAPVPAYNNARETTHADVLCLFDRAIAARKSALDPSRSL